MGVTKNKKSTTTLKTTTARVQILAALIFLETSTLTLCLRLTILADSLGPGSVIHNIGDVKTVRWAVRSATLLVSCNKVGVHTSTDVW